MIGFVLGTLFGAISMFIGSAKDKENYHNFLCGKCPWSKCCTTDKISSTPKE